MTESNEQYCRRMMSQHSNRKTTGNVFGSVAGVTRKLEQYDEVLVDLYERATRQSGDEDPDNHDYQKPPKRGLCS